MGVQCQYCGGEAELVKGDVVYPHRPDLRYLNFWYCDNDHEPAYVGCHKKNERYKQDGTQPLGVLADSKLRVAKSKAHKAFDPLWEDGHFQTRKKAYIWLATKMGLPLEQCHIGMFNEEQCEQVVEICDGYFDC